MQFLAQKYTRMYAVYNVSIATQSFQIFYDNKNTNVFLTFFYSQPSSSSWSSSSSSVFVSWKENNNLTYYIFVFLKTQKLTKGNLYGNNKEWGCKETSKIIKIWMETKYLNVLWTPIINIYTLYYTLYILDARISQTLTLPHELSLWKQLLQHFILLFFFSVEQWCCIAVVLESCKETLFLVRL